MSLATLLNEPCTFTPITRGDDTEDRGIPVTTVCYAEQRGASEDNANTARQTQTWMVMLPADFTGNGHGELEIPGRGLLLDVQGPPHRVRNPRTRTIHHVELTGTEVS